MDFDILAAVDEIFDRASPGEILREWNEWGCGKYADAGTPILVQFKTTEIYQLHVTEPSKVHFNGALRDEAHPHAEALANLYKIDFNLCTNSELALAA